MWNWIINHWMSIVLIVLVLLACFFVYSRRKQLEIVDTGDEDLDSKQEERDT
jgi:hypothetical protein